jgi:hypothetical protein
LAERANQGGAKITAKRCANWLVKNEGRNEEPPQPSRENGNSFEEVGHPKAHKRFKQF